MKEHSTICISTFGNPEKIKKFETALDNLVAEFNEDKENHDANLDRWQ